jgi:CRISPR-associated protein (TIGR02584 family)
MSTDGRAKLRKPIATANQLPPQQVEKSKIVLLAVTGMTPAVLTETVWALAHENPSVIPDTVVVVTTRKGRELLTNEVLSPLTAGGDDLWSCLRKAILGKKLEQGDKRLNLEPPRVITAPNPRTGRSIELEDFRTSAENDAMADFVLEQVRGFVGNPGINLITSIAGGRKTLGALLYASMSLLGRETDRLTHVLVSEPFDSFGVTPRFYYPKQPAQQLKTAEGRILLAAQAQIDLGDIPFVPLRNLFERDLVTQPHSFTELVKRCRAKVNEAVHRNVKLTIRRSANKITVNGVDVKTTTVQQVLMLFMTDQATLPVRLHKIHSYASAVDDLKKFALRIGKPFANQNTFSEDDIKRNLSDLRDRIKEAVGASNYLIDCLPGRKRENKSIPMFSLDLPPSAISIRD